MKRYGSKLVLSFAVGAMLALSQVFPQAAHATDVQARPVDICRAHEYNLITNIRHFTPLYVNNGSGHLTRKSLLSMARYYYFQYRATMKCRQYADDPIALEALAYAKLNLAAANLYESGDRVRGRKYMRDVIMGLNGLKHKSHHFNIKRELTEARFLQAHPESITVYIDKP